MYQSRSKPLTETSQIYPATFRSLLRRVSPETKNSEFSQRHQGFCYTPATPQCLNVSMSAAIGEVHAAPPSSDGGGASRMARSISIAAEAGHARARSMVNEPSCVRRSGQQSHRRCARFGIASSTAKRHCLQDCLQEWKDMGLGSYCLPSRLVALPASKC